MTTPPTPQGQGSVSGQANDGPSLKWASLRIETLAAIKAIDKATRWSEHEPQWWLHMMHVERVHLWATEVAKPARHKQTRKHLTPNEMTPKLLGRAVKALERIATALETVIDRKKKTLRMVDVERGKVYKTHLGGKLRK